MTPFWTLPWGDQPRFAEPPWVAQSPDEAQGYLNVPLLWPEEGGWPEGVSPRELTVRPEGEDHWASARLVMAGQGRRLRLKQFCFDWWRPTELTAGMARALGFFRAGEGVVAWGRDRRGRVVATGGWGRTTIELRIERGTFVEVELRQLMGQLRPAVPEALTLLTAPAFHEIAYHLRRGWGPRGLDELAAAEWYTTPPPDAPSPLLLPDPMPPGWRFDAAATWLTPPPHESQWLLRDAQGMIVCYARARPTKDPQPLKLPAVYRWQEGWRARQTMVRRRRATLAHQHPDLGGWSAAWAESGHRYQLFVRAGTLAGERAFLALLDSLRPP